MKPLAFTLCAAGIGFLTGLGLTGVGAHSEPYVRLSPRKSAASAPRSPGFANQAVVLTPAKWPAFFRARMNHPDGTRLAERLWAEQDPAGFWRWLIQQHDGTMLKNYGKDLLHVWSLTDPDAAMRAADAITDKSTSDLLRREVIETTLTVDLEKGLALAAQAGDFNHFSWGERDWISHDPAAAARGLAALPARSEYRDYLNYAVENWAKKDTPALLAWLKTQPAPDEQNWYQNAFKFAAASDSQAALDAANHLTDPTARDAAITGVLSSGKIPPQDIITALPGLTYKQQSQIAIDAVQNLPMQTAGQIAQATQLLLAAPTNRNTLACVDRISRKFKTTDERLDWASLLPDRTLRRGALESAASEANAADADQIAAAASTLPILDLSNRFFANALHAVPEAQREEWIAKLPPDRAAWARAAMGTDK